MQSGSKMVATDKPSPQAIYYALTYVRRLVLDRGLEADDSAIVPVTEELVRELEKHSSGDRK
jgi:hypothetical protein